MPARKPQKKFQGVLIFGAPASGKGTQAESIVTKYGYSHLSTGDILREEVKAGTPLGLEAKGFMDNGALVPDEVIIKMIKNKLVAAKEKGWLLDGMPRTLAQAEALDKMGCVPDTMIVLDVPDSELVKRVCGRRSDPQTGKIYHLTFNPPPPEIASRMVQRSDDTEDKLTSRLTAYHKNLQPILEYYGKQNKVLRINGNQSKEAVWSIIEAHLS
eukprot:TRINITY_DN704_c0_g1_i2.p1 TRINITY_DN704_c0_g1~~TRINITY_DN704_c0_g1_i2.p1  ORF type:complete len:214 (+),score=62.45 TRINITY_DN704_c0_g1_i2:446-1087(+)